MAKSRRPLARLGVDFGFSSDHPHPEGADDPTGRFERTFEGIDEAAKEQFYHGNFETMFA